MKNADPLFWPSSEIDMSLRQSMNKNYTDCINILQTQWYQADVDQRFAIGDQDIWGLIFPGVATYRRKMFNFNIINSILQMITGFQRRNRKSTVCIPVQSAMQKTSDQLTKCLYHIHKNGVYQTYSDAFEQGALTQGLGFISIYKDTVSDPISGDICTSYIDMKRCLFDPYFRKHDGSDMRFFWTRTFLDRKEAALIHPKYADDILSLPRGTYRDDKFFYMPEVYQIQFPNLIAFDEYWYLTDREATYLVDRETEECQEFQGDEEDLRVIMQQFKKDLRVIKKRKPTYRRSIILNDKTFIDEPNPYGIDRLPYVPCLAYFTPDTPYYAYKFRGVVRDLRDAQYLYNRRKVTDLDILESQQQGLKIRQGSLVTPEDSQHQGNGRTLFYKKEASPDDIQPMPIIPPAPVMIEMEELLKQAMHQISGVSPEMMGQDIDDKAGIITMMRNAAGTTTLTRLFDQFDECQRLCGDIMIEMIQKNWTYGKVRQVIGEDPTSEFDNKAFFNYGCKVVQGALTETQQQLQLQQLLYFRETTGIPIPSKLILEASVLQNKDELIEAVMQVEQQQQQQQQQMQQLQMQQLQVENKTKIAYANAQDGLAAERIGKLQLDKALNAERLQRAQEDKSAAILNLVKAAKELEGMNIDNLQKEVNILLSLKENVDSQNITNVNPGV